MENLLAELQRKFRGLKVQQQEKDYLELFVRNWGVWVSECDDEEDDDFQVLSYSSTNKLESIIEDLQEKHNCQINWNENEKNYIDFRVSLK